MDILTGYIVDVVVAARQIDRPSLLNGAPPRATLALEVLMEAM